MGRFVMLPQSKIQLRRDCGKIGRFNEKMADFCGLPQSSNCGTKTEANGHAKNGGFLPFWRSAAVAAVTPFRGFCGATEAAAKWCGVSINEMRA